MSIAAAVMISTLLAGLRLAGHKSQTFQAVAHLWVGALIAHVVDTGSRTALWNVVVISLVELFAFLRGAWRASGGEDSDR